MMKKKWFLINGFFKIFFFVQLLLFANVSDPEPSDFLDITDDNPQSIEFSYSVYFHSVPFEEQ